MKRHMHFKSSNIPDLLDQGVNVQFTNGNGKTINTHPTCINCKAWVQNRRPLPPTGFCIIGSSDVETRSDHTCNKFEQK
jgi:hypothetical protein